MFALLFAIGRADAHGGVSIEDDTCIITIGNLRAHFSGYQPAVRASQEFCEDIPVASNAIIVIDYISNALRDMRVDFRIIEDVNNIGVDATYADLGTEQAIEAATITYVPPKQYRNGNFSVELLFNEPGNFIGIMSAEEKFSKKVYFSVFPFSVGKSDWSTIAIWLFAVLVIGSCAAFFGLRKR